MGKNSRIKDVIITNNYKTLYLIKYKNSENKNLIIDCCQDYVVIYNPFNEEIYATIDNEKTKGDNRNACIIYNKNKTDYLLFVNEYGFIIMYDLKNRKIVKTLHLESELYNILDWNDNYFIITQYKKNYLVKFKLGMNNIEKFIEWENKIICIKNITLNKKEELIFAAGKNSSNIFILYYSQSEINDIKEKNIW